MGILLDKVRLSQEAEKQGMVQMLLAAGITNYKNQSIYDLGYYDLRYLVSREGIQNR